MAKLAACCLVERHLVLEEKGTGGSWADDPVAVQCLNRSLLLVLAESAALCFFLCVRLCDVSFESQLLVLVLVQKRREESAERGQRGTGSVNLV